MICIVMLIWSHDLLYAFINISSNIYYNQNSLHVDPDYFFISQWSTFLLELAVFVLLMALSLFLYQE